MPSSPRFHTFISLVATLALATGCASGGTTRHATSVVNYLYPEKSDVVESPGIPTLSLPLRVGIAFVPGQFDRSTDAAAYPEADRLALMEEVAAHFRKYPFVKTIEIIPSAYLTPKGGFANLDQLRNMFNVDVVTLLSYDQVQFTDEKRSAITYWTIIGAYIVEGEKNDTRTLMDAVVYDIASRKLLFRAPGVSSVKGSSTPIKLSEERRRDSETGFRLASQDLIKNLDAQLLLFRDKVKSAPTEYRVVQRPGSGGGSGGGSTDALFAAVVGALAGCHLWLRRRKDR
ncbi:MAG TPA: rhombotarget lipoprotein [Gemmatimonadaceae bacterium]|nr:rhombotarget lipoprotein [Gemmatimonadaceae bacterium]